MAEEMDNIGSSEPDTGPSSAEVSHENSASNLTVPAKDRAMSKTDESLQELGAGQPYPCKYK